MIPYIPGAAEGFSKGLGNSIEEANQNKLKMALLSSQIQQEAQARMSEMEKQHELNTIPKAQGQALAKSLGFNIPNEAGDLSQGTLDAFLAAAGNSNRAQAMMNKPVPYNSKPDGNNLIVTGHILPMTGQILPGAQQTLEPTAQHEIMKVDNQVQNAQNMIKGISQRSQSILANAPEGVPLQKLDAWFQKHGMPTNPDLKAYIDSLGSLSAQYIKDTTGMAPRSLELMHLDMSAFPTPEDDAKTAAQKIQILNQTMANKAGAVHQIYDPTNFLKSQLHPLAIGQQQGQMAAASQDPQTRFHQLIMQGKTKQQAYAQMKAEGL